MSSLLYFTLSFLCVDDKLCMCSFTFLLIGGEDIYTKYHTDTQREKEREREHATVENKNV